MRVSAARIAALVVVEMAWATMGAVTAAPVSPPVPVAVFSWTGCYLGGHVGAGWGSRDFSNANGFPLADGSPLFFPPLPLRMADSLPFDQSVSGMLAGAQAGCKYEFAPNFVFGIEGGLSDARLFGFRGLVLEPFAAAPATLVPTSLWLKTEWLASVTANLGYAFGNFLVYADGGPAWTHNKYQFYANVPAVAPIAAADFEASETRNGWTVGGGIEYRFWRNLTGRLEYNYYSFGTKNVPFVDQLSATGAGGTLAVKQQIQTIKFGLNYYFLNDTAQMAYAAVPAVATTFPAMTWTETFSSEARYFSWHSTRGIPTNAVSSATGTPVPLTTPGSGSEIYIPYSTQLVGQSDAVKIELNGRGGWVRATQSSAGLMGSVETATDTVFSGTITYLGLKGFQPFVSLDLNLPTGRAALPPMAVNARMDPDLVDIADFGEGLNVGPTFGVNMPITDSFVLTTSVGFTRRGSYDREGQLTPPGGGATPTTTRLQPGDVTTFTATAAYQTDTFSANLTGTVSKNTTTNENDVPFVRPGKSYLLSGSASYAWPWEHAGKTTLNASLSHSNLNEVMFQCLAGCPTSLVTEPFNTNSNLYRISVDHLFDFDPFGIGPTGSYLYRDHNGYQPTTLQFVPAKQRWSAGVLTRYDANKTVTFNARVERVWTRENDTPALPSGDEQYSVLAGSTVTAFEVPIVNGTGWQCTFGATVSF